MYIRATILAVSLLIGGLSTPAHSQEMWNGAWKEMKAFLGFKAKPKQPSIKVLLASDVSSLLLEVKGGYNIYNPLNNQRLGTRFLGKTCLVEARSGGLKWGEQFPAVYQIALVPDDEHTSMLVDGIEYKGTIYVYQVGSSHLSVVNEVSIEDFVKSTLALEFEEALVPEAMAAVVIAKRTDVYYQVASSDNHFWDVSLEMTDYRGFGVTHRGNGVDRAVDLTKNLVMKHLVGGNEVAFPAKYTMDSAGKTAPYHVMFRQYLPGPELGSEAPLAALHRPDSTWEYRLSADRLAQIAGIEKVEGLHVYRDKESGKVYAIRFKDDSEAHAMGFVELQEKLGAENLRSSDFVTQLENGEFVFKGYGEGHGVGLCLYSAEEMANRGADASRILGAFFPQTEIVALKKKVL